MVHIMYEGTKDVSLEDLFPAEYRDAQGITGELTPTNISADQIKSALANHFDKPLDEFNELVVEYHKNGNITVRPGAILGI